MTSSRKLRILQTESSLNWGGQEERLLVESTWLAARGHQVAVACGARSELCRRAEAAGLRVFPYQSRKGASPSGLLAAHSIVRKFLPHIVQTHSSIDAWQFLPARLHGAAVVRSRNISLSEKSGRSRGLVYRLCNGVVAASGSIAADLSRKAGVPAERVRVVGSYVCLDDFDPEADGRAFREAWGFSSEHFVFGVVAMLRGEKGHRGFLKAAGRIFRRDKRLRFVLVGGSLDDGEFRAVLEEMVAELFPDAPEAVVFAGFQDDIPRVMAALDCLVVPSSNEAQTLVIPQAFASGRPVIASNVGGISELVRDGETGLLVAPSSPNELASTMQRLAEDSTLRESLAAKGREFALRELADEKIFTRLEEWFLSLTGSKEVVSGDDTD